MENTLLFCFCFCFFSSTFLVIHVFQTLVDFRVCEAYRLHKSTCMELQSPKDKRENCSGVNFDFFSLVFILISLLFIVYTLWISHDSFAQRLRD